MKKVRESQSIFLWDSEPCLSVSDLIPFAWLSSHSWWAYSANNGTALRLGMFAMASLLLNGSKRHYPGQTANYSNSLFQPEEPTCHTVSWKRKQEIQPLHWSDCWGQFGKVSIIQQNHTNHTFKFVDWGSLVNFLKSRRNIITAPGLIDQALEAFINLRQVSGLIRTYCWIGIMGAYHPHDPGLSSPVWGQSNGTFGKFQQP